MKKLLIIEAVLFVVFMFTIDKVDAVSFVALLGFIVIPIFFLVKKIMNNKKAKSIPVKEEPATEPVVEERPKIEKSYVYLKDTDTIGNKFVRYYRSDLQENDEYYRANKDLKDDYYNEKIYQYEPLEVPYKIEGDQVFSYMKDDEWQFVGKIREKQMFLIEKSIDTKLYLMPNTYKRVGDGYVQKESGDSYFGLLVTIEK